MNIEQVITNDLITKVSRFEGFRSKPYLCPSGCWTIGFGHVLSKYDDISLTYAEALVILKADLRIRYIQLSNVLNLDLFEPLQVAALLDFVFNCGIGTLQKSSCWFYLKKYNRKYSSTKKAYDAVITGTLLKYCFSKGKRLNGLYLRRKFEVSLWQLNPLY